MRFRHRKDRGISAIDITPLVDVVFLLLIFFMLSLGSPLKISQVDLPESVSGDGLAREAVTVAIRSGGLLIDGREAGRDMLASLPAEKDIVILADKSVAYFEVITILDALRSSGHERISLATRPLKN
jgi:biopolymer transport protein ExbD